MQIFFVNLKGITLTIDIECKARVQDLKNKITEIDGSTSYSQRLIFRTRPLQEQRTLEFYGIHHECTIHCVGRFGWNPPTFVVKISEKCRLKFIPKTFYPTKGTFLYLKDFKDEIIKYLNEDKIRFNNIYNISYYTMTENDRFNNTIPIWNGSTWLIHYGDRTTFHVKTKKSNEYYRENEYKIKEKRCNLSVFGFVREIEIKNNYNIPIYITQICHKYYNSLIPLCYDNSIKFSNK
eukprot:490465_1